MIFANELKPPLDEAMWHYGVMGMKWGVRKDRSTKSTRSPRLSPGQKKALKITTGALLIAGATTAAVILASSGNGPAAASVARSGTKAVRAMANNASGTGNSRFNPSAGQRGGFNPNVGINPGGHNFNPNAGINPRGHNFNPNAGIMKPASDRSHLEQSIMDMSLHDINRNAASYWAKHPELAAELNIKI